MCTLNEIFNWLLKILSIPSFLSWQIIVLSIFLYLRKPILKMLNEIQSLRYNSIELLFKNHSLKNQFNKLIGVSDSSNLDGIKVLWVDDEPDNNSLLIEYLKGNNAIVIEARNTKDALNYIKNEKFKIVISDMHRSIDGENAGLDLFNKIQEQNKNMYQAIKKYIFCGEYNVQRHKENSDKLGIKITSSGEKLIKLILKDLNNQ